MIYIYLSIIYLKKKEILSKPVVLKLNFSVHPFHTGSVKSVQFRKIFLADRNKCIIIVISASQWYSYLPITTHHTTF